MKPDDPKRERWLAVVQKFYRAGFDDPDLSMPVRAVCKEIGAKFSIDDVDQLISLFIEALGLEDTR